MRCRHHVNEWNLLTLGKKGLCDKTSMIYRMILDKSGARRCQIWVKTRRRRSQLKLRHLVENLADAAGVRSASLVSKEQGRL